MSTKGQWSGSFDGDWFGDVEGGSVVNLSAIITGLGGVAGNLVAVAVSVDSGGYFEPNTRRRTKREAYAERERLRISIQDVDKAAEKVIDKQISPKQSGVVDKSKIEYYYRPDVADLVKLLMLELRVTVALPDYRQAIEIAIAAKLRREDEEDLEDLLLLM